MVRKHSYATRPAVPDTPTGLGEFLSSATARKRSMAMGGEPELRLAVPPGLRVGCRTERSGSRRSDARAARRHGRRTAAAPAG